jgi:hypothetical protein
MKISDRVKIDSVAHAVAMGGCAVLAFLAAELHVYEQTALESHGGGALGRPLRS